MSTIIQPTARKSTRPARRESFGAGLFASMPNYRLDCTISDPAWYEEQLAMEEERELARRFREFEAQNRLDAGLDGW
jgi:hypothetical protein